MNEIKYISTNNLTAIIVEKDYIKIMIYRKIKSPYGWNKRELLHSPNGVEEKDFNYDYIKIAVDKVYDTFPDDQIKELINKVNKYYEKSEKQVD